MFDAVTYALLQQQIATATSTGNIKLSEEELNALKKKPDGLYVEETQYETEDIDFSQF